MTTGPGVGLIGGWFGTGVNRGIAIIFILAAIIGLAATLIALASRQYRELSAKYMESVKQGGQSGGLSLDDAVKEGLMG